MLRLVALIAHPDPSSAQQASKTINGAGALINQASLTLQSEILDATLDNQVTGMITVLPGTTQLNGTVTQAGTIDLNGEPPPGSSETW